MMGMFPLIVNEDEGIADTTIEKWERFSECCSRTLAPTLYCGWRWSLLLLRASLVPKL
jgi:hypothetical protein